MASAIWSPTRYIGWRHANGSWKIMARSLPRTFRSSFGLRARRFCPMKLISPEMVADFVLVRPSAVRQVTLLPEPLSPTMPNVSPRWTLNERPSTARTTPSGVANDTWRSLTSRRVSAMRRPPSPVLRVSDTRIEPRVHDVDDEGHEGDEERDHHGRPEHGRQVASCGRLEDPLADAREVDDGLGDHGAAHKEREVDAEQRRDRRQARTEAVTADDPRL